MKQVKVQTMTTAIERLWESVRSETTFGILRKTECDERSLLLVKQTHVRKCNPLQKFTRLLIRSIGNIGEAERR